LHPDVKKLIEVQKVDQAISRSRRDLVSIPTERVKREKALEALRVRFEEQANQLREAEVHGRASETGIRQADDELKKLDVRLNTVKNNAEYQATLLQMESIRKERERLEEEGLALLDKVESLKGIVTELGSQRDTEARVFAEFLQEAERITEKREAEVRAITAGRAGVAAGIPPDLLQKYERLFEARGGLAVCAVEGQTCTGCYTSIPPNLQVKLQTGSAVVQCASCQRILYLAE
jgi:hypothetical protein